MSTILNFQVKDDILNSVFSNNPCYVDISGEVNLCLVKCGQEIESCNNIEFSTMTNYGKILVLNPNPNKIGSCAIKLAYDTSNDNTNNNGDASYTFEKAFVTVPSLHKINEKIFDMETFLLFSSKQKDGSTIFVCICSLSMGTDNVAAGDWKLLNYKLLNELFSKNNKVPDIFGTTEIKDSPNPVDLANFIPSEGFRNFYDYSHPLNTKVNFRIYQTPLAVSNQTLNILRDKLTPKNMYTNFREAINNHKNPIEGLYFYFSEDLTNRYKSFAINDKKSPSDINENMAVVKSGSESDALADKIIKEQEDYETSLDPEPGSGLETSNGPDPKDEKFDPLDVPPIQPISQSKPDNTVMIYTMCILGLYLVINGAYYVIIRNGLGGGHENNEKFIPDEADASKFNELMVPKLRYFALWILQAIITMIIWILLILNITNTSNYDNLKIGIYILMSMITIVGCSCFYYLISYLYNGLNLKSTNNFSENENYFYGQLREKFTSNPLSIIMFLWKGNTDSVFLESFDIVKQFSQKGGNKNMPIYVPGPNLDKKNKNGKNNSNNPISPDVNSLYDFISDIFIGENIKNKIPWTTYIILFGILVSGIFLNGVISNNLVSNRYANMDCVLQFFISLNTTLFCFIPSAMSLVFFFARIYTSLPYWQYISWIFRAAVITTLILSTFVPAILCTGANNNYIYFVGIIIFVILLLIYGIYILVKGIIKGNLPIGLPSKPVDLDNPSQVQQLLIDTTLKITDIRYKITLYEKHLSTPGFEGDQEAINELLMLKSELEKNILLQRELELQLQDLSRKALSMVSSARDMVKGTTSTTGTAGTAGNGSAEIARLKAELAEKDQIAQDLIKAQEKIQSLTNMVKLSESSDSSFDPLLAQDLVKAKEEIQTLKNMVKLSESTATTAPTPSSSSTNPNNSSNIIKAGEEINRLKERIRLLESLPSSPIPSTNPNNSPNIIKAREEINRLKEIIRLSESLPSSSLNNPNNSSNLIKKEEEINRLKERIRLLESLPQNSVKDEEIVRLEERIKDLSKVNPSYPNLSEDLTKSMEEIIRLKEIIRLSESSNPNSKVAELSKQLLEAYEQIQTLRETSKLSTGPQNKNNSPINDTLIKNEQIKELQEIIKLSESGSSSAILNLQRKLLAAEEQISSLSTNLLQSEEKVSALDEIIRIITNILRQYPTKNSAELLSKFEGTENKDTLIKLLENALESSKYTTIDSDGDSDDEYEKKLYDELGELQDNLQLLTSASSENPRNLNIQSNIIKIGEKIDRKTELLKLTQSDTLKGIKRVVKLTKDAAIAKLLINSSRSEKASLNTIQTLLTKFLDILNKQKSLYNSGTDLKKLHAAFNKFQTNLGIS